MSVHTEATFEANIETHLVDHGWTSVDPSGYDRKVGLFPDELVAFLRTSQPKDWAQLEKQLGPGAAPAKVVARVASEIDARGTVDVLRGSVKLNGVALRLCYFAPANGLTPALRDRYDANRLGVVRQLHHSETRPADSLDLVLLVNGIPTATAELKNSLTGQGVEQAVDQYRTDRAPGDTIFARRALVHFAVDPVSVMMTTRLDGERTRFLPFDQGSGGPGQPGGRGNPTATVGYATAYLWEQVWQRDAWLDLVGSYVHVSGTGSAAQVLFPRFHQWHAVRAVGAATRRDGAGVDRLVQHSAGSGKSNTIAWTAHALSRLHGDDDTPVFDKVVVITDRRVLDRQLQQTVGGFEQVPGTIVRIDTDSAQLRSALEGHTARVVITTLQKFPVIADAAEPTEVAGRRFAVIVDEAHSSSSGDGIKKLKGVLTDGETADLTDTVEASARARGKHATLSFFAFTATPKPKTLELFGQPTGDGEGAAEQPFAPFHVYSMRQAIEEEFILDVLRGYTTYQTFYKLATTEQRDDPELPVAKARAAMARYVSLHPTNLAAKAAIIVEHFRSKTAHRIDGRAKAMVVTRSRLHAVRYHAAITTYITEQGYDTGPRPLRALVAFSGTLEDPDVPEVSWTEAALNGFGESQLPAKFAGEEFHLLVVAEKYQTGFDQPLLHTMYVDKKLSGVAAVQTLSRLNRTHPGKEDTFVLDFANTTEEIEAAFQQFYEVSLATPTDPNDLYAFEHTVRAAGVLVDAEMEAAVTALLSGVAADQAVVYANLGPAVERFTALEEEPAEEFRSTLASYVRAYSFLAQVMPWTERALEVLFAYGKALLPLLPAEAGSQVPQLSNAVRLTHLRTALIGDAEDIGLTVGEREPGQALPGHGTGSRGEEELDRLSALVATMNERFGLDLGEADQILFDQQHSVVKADDELRAVAVSNVESSYRDVLEDRLDAMIADRHHANTALFDAFFDKPEFRALLVEYLASSTYAEFRAEAAGGGA